MSVLRSPGVGSTVLLLLQNADRDDANHTPVAEMKGGGWRQAASRDPRTVSAAKLERGGVTQSFTIT